MLCTILTEIGDFLSESEKTVQTELNKIVKFKEVNEVVRKWCMKIEERCTLLRVDADKLCDKKSTLTKRSSCKYINSNMRI